MSSKFKLVLILVGLAAVLLAGKILDAQDLLRQALNWVADLGPWGPVVFGGIYILAAIFFVPGSILTLGAGVIFGLAKGVLVVIISATLGATAAFLIGRYLARDWVARKIQGNEKFRVIDEAVAREGWKIVGLIRLSPVFPFNLLNYAFGLTKVGLRDYFLATFVGMIPAICMYVYLGSLAGNLARLESGGGARSPVEWALYGVGLVATIGVTIYVTRVARRALNRQVGL